MNALQRIVFAAMDWLTDGALTENRHLKFVNEQLFKDRNYWCKSSADFNAEVVRLERANFELAKDNLRLKDIIRVYGGRTEIDKFVSDQTKIRDMQFRIDCLVHRLEKYEGPAKPPGNKNPTGKQMGLC